MFLCYPLVFTLLYLPSCTYPLVLTLLPYPLALPSRPTLSRGSLHDRPTRKHGVALRHEIRLRTSGGDTVGGGGRPLCHQQTRLGQPNDGVQRIERPGPFQSGAHVVWCQSHLDAGGQRGPRNQGLCEQWHSMCFDVRHFGGIHRQCVQWPVQLVRLSGKASFLQVSSRS